MIEKREGDEDESDGAGEKPPTVVWDQSEAESIEAQPSELINTDGNEQSQTAGVQSSADREAPSVAEPAIVRKHDGTETTGPTSSKHAAADDDEGRAYKTQPLLSSSTHSNTTVANLSDGNVRRPGDSRPRGKESNVLARVDKIRKVSSVMIDQAAYDPSLRFLLVAGALFVIFVILMIASKVLG